MQRKKKYLILVLLVFDLGFILNYSHYDLLNKLFVLCFILLSGIFIMLLIRKNKKETKNSTAKLTVPNSHPLISVTTSYQTSNDNYLKTILPNGKTIRQSQARDYKESLEYEKNSNNPKFHRTEIENEQSSKFHNDFYQTIDLAESELVRLANSINGSDDIETKILKCKKTISHFERFRAFCISQGQGGSLYFEDMWDHCHNSKNSDFSYITTVYEKLEELEDRKMNIDTNAIIRAKLVEIVKEETGILQREIYDKFETKYKDIIRYELRFMEINKEIRRVKSGNSYRLYIK